MFLKDIEKKKAHDDGWDDPPGTRFLTLEEKWELEADDPLHFIDPETGKQTLEYPDGRVEVLTPDHPLYNHWWDK